MDLRQLPLHMFITRELLFMILFHPFELRLEYHGPRYDCLGGNTSFDVKHRQNRWGVRHDQYKTLQENATPQSSGMSDVGLSQKAFRICVIMTRQAKPKKKTRVSLVPVVAKTSLNSQTPCSQALPIGNDISSSYNNLNNNKT